MYCRFRKIYLNDRKSYSRFRKIYLSSRKIYLSDSFD